MIWESSTLGLFGIGVGALGVGSSGLGGGGGGGMGTETPTPRNWGLDALRSTQRAQCPFIKEYGLNYIGLHIMI